MSTQKKTMRYLVTEIIFKKEEKKGNFYIAAIVSFWMHIRKSKIIVLYKNLSAVCATSFYPQHLLYIGKFWSTWLFLLLCKEDIILKVITICQLKEQSYAITEFYTVLIVLFFFNLSATTWISRIYLRWAINPICP